MSIGLRCALAFVVFIAAPACAEFKETTAEGGAALKEGWGITKEATKDTTIGLAIRSGFADDPDVKSKPIKVDVKEGVVTLTGSQPTYEGRRHAEDIARSIKGVVRVDNKLTIDPVGGHAD